MENLLEEDRKKKELKETTTPEYAIGLPAPTEVAADYHIYCPLLRLLSFYCSFIEFYRKEILKKYPTYGMFSIN